MKKYYIIGAVSLTIVFNGCSIFKARPPKYAIDPVCKMKVDEREAYSEKYNGQEYYFDTYTCKESFKMNPEVYLVKKNCDTK
jgi:YHS domain-containing protein